MTDNFCYLWFVLGEPFDEEREWETMTRIWTNALRLTPAEDVATVQDAS